MGMGRGRFVAMVVAVILAVLVILPVVMIVIAGFAFQVDVEFHALDAHLLFPRGVQVVAVEGQFLQLPLQGAELNAEIQQRAEEHVAADAAEQIEIERFHGKREGELRQKGGGVKNGELKMKNWARGAGLGIR